MDRRWLGPIVASLLVFTAWGIYSPELSRAAEIEIPSTGRETEASVRYDQLIKPFMQRWDLPGCSLAVARQGQLVLARSYGYANVEKQQTVKPSSLFRLASISKPITAVAILQLVEQGQLNLDDKVCDVLQLTPDKTSGDARWRDVTLRQLLQHTGGWDRSKATDPMFRPFEAAEKIGEQSPASAQTVIRFMLGQPMQHDPGSHYSYSNFGYCLLGRVIEARTKLPYDEAVKQRVLTPCGIHDMRIGSSRLSGRSPQEVHYYVRPAGATSANVFDKASQVDVPDGGFHLEAMDSHGGWIASTVDLMRFITSVEGSREPRLLKSESLVAMTARPTAPVSVDTPTYYGLGWNIRPQQPGANWWHGGSLPGTATLLVHTSRGFCWSILFNARPDNATEKKLGNFSRELDDLLWKAADGVEQWGAHDLFRDVP